MYVSGDGGGVLYVALLCYARHRALVVVGGVVSQRTNSITGNNTRIDGEREGGEGAGIERQA